MQCAFQFFLRFFRLCCVHVNFLHVSRTYHQKSVFNTFLVLYMIQKYITIQEEREFSQRKDIPNWLHLLVYIQCDRDCFKSESACFASINFIWPMPIRSRKREKERKPIQNKQIGRWNKSTLRQSQQVYSDDIVFHILFCQLFRRSFML